MSRRSGDRRGGRGGGRGDLQRETDPPRPASQGQRDGRGRGRGGAPPPQRRYQERTMREDLPASSSAVAFAETSTLSKELEEGLHIGGSSAAGASAGSSKTSPTLLSQQEMLAVGAALPTASSKALVHPPRPGFGTLGQKCIVKANHFLVRVKDMDIFQYEVKFDPEVKSRALGRDLMKKLVEQFGKSHLGQRMPAYDGRNIFYTAGSLPFNSKDFEINYSGRDREKTYKISIKFTKVSDMHPLRQFLQGRQRDCPYDTIQALDVVLREYPSENYVTISRSFFAPGFGCNVIGDGLECWKGYFQSLRPAQMGLSLNVDLSATSFYSPVNLIDFVTQYLNIRSFSTGFSESIRIKILKVLKGIRVETQHIPNMPRCYRIMGITTQSASQLKFIVDENGGSEMSVAQYFQEKYNYSLKYDLPCIKAGSDSRPKYLPMEVCKIVKGQRYVKKLTEKQVSSILKSACQRPSEREKSISKLVMQNNYSNDKHAKSFSVDVDLNLTRVEARVLPPPRLKYHDSGREKICHPNVGQWNMINKRMVDGAAVDAWACICFARVPSDAVQNFCKDLVFMCNNIGMVMNLISYYHAIWFTLYHLWMISYGLKWQVFDPNPVLNIYFRQPAQVENSIRELHQHAIESLKQMNKKHKQLQLLLIVLPDASGSYGRIKRLCETELGLVSQCCKPTNLYKGKQYLENVALKINVKAGGRNTVLEDALNKRIPFVSDLPTIIFGADVTHPSPGEDSSPSIAAVVASMDWPWVMKYRGLISAQKHRQEIIEDLFKVTENPQRGNVAGGMIRELLVAFYKETKQKPHRIIFYRDGVSEGQFSHVLLFEMEAIRKACASLEEGYLPPVTFVVVQKRHHTRLFPEDHNRRDLTDRSGNILPGTVVDRTICHPTEFDFYLCSHAGIQGTSRPTHYHVLYDENNFSADGLQRLTNNLCYTFARCTRSVSIVPPAYYAHLAAFRARWYIEGESDSGSSHAGMSGMRQKTPLISSLPSLKENIKDVMFYC